jgi:periplasmic protein TonB
MKSFLFISFSICFLTTYAQDKNKFYALDANLHETVLDSSKYILWVHKEDSSWQFDYYRTWGPLVKSQTFADREGSVLNGRSSIYNTWGNLDSTGIFSYNKKNGLFIKFRSNGKDSIQEMRRYEYKNDSLLNMVNLQETTKKKSPGYTSVLVSSNAPIGDSSWTGYLLKYLKYPERAASKNIEGTVLITFQVDENEDVKNPYILKSVEYSLDQEALRIISTSGKWYQDILNGAKIATEKTMPVVFKLN